MIHTLNDKISQTSKGASLIRARSNSCCRYLALL